MGNPRKNGNTAILLNRVIEGAQKEGAQCQVFYLNDLNIRGCQGCNGCKKKGHCIILDDMQSIYQTIDKSDVLVFSSPIYVWQMTAQLKLVIDRLYAYMNADFSSRISKPIKFALLFTQHRADKDSFMPYYESVAGILQLIGLKFVPDILVATGLYDVGEIKNDHVLMKKALEFGSKLAL